MRLKHQELNASGSKPICSTGGIARARSVGGLSGPDIVWLSACDTSLRIGPDICCPNANPSGETYPAPDDGWDGKTSPGPGEASTPASIATERMTIQVHRCITVLNPASLAVTAAHLLCYLAATPPTAPSPVRGGRRTWLRQLSSHIIGTALEERRARDWW